MQRLSLYLFQQSGLAFLFAATTVVFVVLFTQSFRLFSFVIDNAGTMLIFFQLMGLMMLTFLPLVLPISLGIATVFTYNKLAVDSELVVMRSVGASPVRLARPAILLSAFVVFIGYALTLWITPWANNELVSIQYRVRDNFSVFLIKSGTFNDVADGLTFYSRNRGKNGDLEDILIHDVRTPRRPVTIMAENGQFILDNDGQPQITVFKGIRQEVNRDTGKLSQLDFDRYVVDLQVSHTGKSNRQADPREQTTEMLINRVYNAPRSLVVGKGSTDRLFAELHQRLTTPLLALGFCLIGVTSILVGSFNRRGMTKRIVVAALSIIILETSSLSLDNLIAKNEWMVWVLYFIILLPIPLCLTLLCIDDKMKLPILSRHRPNKGAAS